MVLVNTIVLVRGVLGLEELQVAVALGFFGGGSMLAALILPRLLDRLPDRLVMMCGAAILLVALIALALVIEIDRLVWGALLGAWLAIGIGYSAVLTPSGRLLRRSTHAEDRPAVFAAQFALSHACWLVTYPLAGWLITTSGPAIALFSLAALAIAGMILAAVFWPNAAEQELEHRHEQLPNDHPHILGSRSHSHVYVIDDYHPHWPRHG